MDNWREFSCAKFASIASRPEMSPDAAVALASPPEGRKQGNRMTRDALRARAALICLGLCLPIAVGRAEDTGDATSASIARQAGRNDGGTGSSGGVESAARGPTRRSVAPWADPPRDSSVAPWPRTTPRPMPSQNYFWARNPLAQSTWTTERLNTRRPRSLRGNQLARKPPDRKSRRTLGRDGMFD